jgi:hypothetical protein
MKKENPQTLPQAERAAPDPPIEPPDIPLGGWSELPASDPVTAYLAQNQWSGPRPPQGWEAARLSSAAHVYRERSTGQRVLAKFYAAKTGGDAGKYARREFQFTRQAQTSGLADGELRSVQPLAVWRGVLFLEYADGLTLGDLIAVRRNRPGTLTLSLERAAASLATLHAHSPQRREAPDFDAAIAYAHKVIDTLAKHGVLQDNALVRDGLGRAVDRWAGEPAMRNFVPTTIHGDATTSNFVFPWDGGLVVIDWERCKVADPAADLGRLLAEVSHSISEQGGDVAEAEPLLARAADAYRRTLPAAWDADAIVQRARFYRASSTLRIARNGWLSRLDRTALVAHAFALLT